MSTIATEPIVYLNGEFLPASQAKINIYDYSVVMGVTFTEMTRTFRHQPFRLEEHLQRLYRSLKYGGLSIPLAPVELVDITNQLVAHNAEVLASDQEWEDDAELAIVHFVTAGENQTYAGTRTTNTPQQPTVCVHTFPLPRHLWQHFYKEGAHVVTPTTRHIPPQCVDPKTKNRSRLHWFLADQQARALDPRAIPLLLDLNGNITECTGANFLLVKDRTIYSPTSRNILSGISLQTVRELAAELGLSWVEKDLQLYDAINADEAWITSSTFCMAPCTRINGVAIGNGRIGPLFEEVLGAWSSRVGLDVRNQIIHV